MTASRLRPLAGRTAVVTGAGRHGGLGEAIALRLAADGAAVLLSDIGRSADRATPDAMIGGLDELNAVAEGIRARTGADVSTRACDVRDWAQVEALAAHAVATHGGLDIWINNAGIGYIMKPLLEVEPQDWAAVIDVNLTGSFYGLKAAAAVMVRQGRGGRIVNIASQAAKSGFALAQAYTASKHGLVAERVLRGAAGQERPAVPGRHGGAHPAGPRRPARRHRQRRGLPVLGAGGLHHGGVDERVGRGGAALSHCSAEAPRPHAPPRR